MRRTGKGFIVLAESEGEREVAGVREGEGVEREREKGTCEQFNRVPSISSCVRGGEGGGGDRRWLTRKRKRKSPRTT